MFITFLNRTMFISMATIRISRVPHKKHLYMRQVYDSEEPDNHSLYVNVIIDIVIPFSQQGQRS